MACLDSELLKMKFADVTPLRLSREGSRLLKSGGHTRRHKTPFIPLEQNLLIKSAAGLPMFLEMSASTGARRGEVLALRWSDLQGKKLTIERSLTQTKQVLEFKRTKTDKPRLVALPRVGPGSAGGPSQPAG